MLEACSGVKGILEEIVAIVFWREEVGGGSQTTDEEGRDASTDGAENKGGIEVPAGHGEVLIVFVEKRLQGAIVSKNVL